MYACLIDWQKVSDHVNSSKSMQILKGTGINWRDERLISKLYTDQGVKLRLDEAETRDAQACHRFYSNRTAKYAGDIGYGRDGTAG
jgi:hypothetical protein